MQIEATGRKAEDCKTLPSSNRSAFVLANQRPGPSYGRYYGDVCKRESLMLDQFSYVVAVARLPFMGYHNCGVIEVYVLRALMKFHCRGTVKQDSATQHILVPVNCLPIFGGTRANKCVNFRRFLIRPVHSHIV